MGKPKLAHVEEPHRDAPRLQEKTDAWLALNRSTSLLFRFQPPPDYNCDSPFLDRPPS